MSKEALFDKFKEFRVLLVGLAATVVLIGVYFFRTGPGSDLDNQYSDLDSEVKLLNLSFGFVRIRHADTNDEIERICNLIPGQVIEKSFVQERVE